SRRTSTWATPSTRGRRARSTSSWRSAATGASSRRRPTTASCATSTPSPRRSGSRCDDVQRRRGAGRGEAVARVSAGRRAGARVSPVRAARRRPACGGVPVRRRAAGRAHARRAQHPSRPIRARAAVREAIAEREPELSEEQVTTLARVAAGRLDRAERLVDPAAVARRETLLDVARAVYLDLAFDTSAATARLVAAIDERGTEAREAEE